MLKPKPNTQHKVSHPSLPGGLAYGDHGELVCTVEDDHDGGQTADDERQIRTETLMRLINYLVHEGSSADRIGTRVLLIAFMLHAPGAPSKQRDLARALGVKEAAVSMGLKRVRKQLADMTM